MTETEKEMALALGQYINGKLERISALEAILSECRITNDEGRRVEIPWREDVKRIAQEQSFRRSTDGQSDALLQAIGNETESSALIRALCRHYLQ